MKYWLILLSAFILRLEAQELIANVQVLAPNVQTSDRRVFETLETAIREFLNNRRWTNEQYAPEERITCQFVLNIENKNNNAYDGSLQIFYSRPIFKSDYLSPVFVHQDSKVQFEYIEFDRLDFVENTFTSNLTSILAFYAYVIIGLDHDTFAPNSGGEYYAKAQEVVGNAQNSPNPGWGSFDGNKNRFWLVDNLTSPTFDNYKTCLYMYHRQGLDLMHDNGKIRTAKTNIRNALLGLKSVNDQRRNSFVLQLWFDAKMREIVKIFSGGDPVGTADLKELLEELDPNNADLYQQIGRG